MTANKNICINDVTLVKPIVAITSEPTIASFRYHSQILKSGSHRESRYFNERYQTILDLMEYYGLELKSRDFMVELDDGSDLVPMMLYLMRADLPKMGELKNSFVYLLDLERQHAKAVVTGRTTTATYLSEKIHKSIDLLKRHQYVCKFDVPRRVTAAKQSSGGKRGKYDKFWDSIIEPKLQTYVDSQEGTVEDLRVDIEVAVKVVEPNFRFGSGVNGFDELPRRTVENWLSKYRGDRK
ncbi:hypothetical protein [Vibrio brasiliensis]|uniref:Uncharacterized protein n=1 Tax=Vibrio brasiliensis LMG 20546 TaxID=945543 RepID=E8LYR2_9VIBR|nr:hypothetical protein [Vibrio brasiliensis]EGA64176.1 hypothetical protein VIBR0546_02529 [Vibrio brasiliensis LMG 20546]